VIFTTLRGIFKKKTWWFIDEMRLSEKKIRHRMNSIALHLRPRGVNLWNINVAKATREHWGTWRMQVGRWCLHISIYRCFSEEYFRYSAGICRFTQDVTLIRVYFCIFVELTQYTMLRMQYIFKKKKWLFWKDTFKVFQTMWIFWICLFLIKILLDVVYTCGYAYAAKCFKYLLSILNVDKFNFILTRSMCQKKSLRNYYDSDV